MDLSLIKKKHEEIFGTPAELIVHAPGRINLIGEHTDYSEGFVMPVAINMGITVAISKNLDAKMISVYSMDFDKKMVTLYSDLMKSNQESWFSYPVGVTKILQKNHSFEGIRITFTGNIPQEAGLSSSAALEMAVAFAIQTLYNLNISDVELAKICQTAEQEIVGVRCGIMDQFISRMGKADEAMLIDCRSLEYRSIPFQLKKAKLLITNSNVPRKLISSEYNQRVIECEEAVKILASEKPGTHLRDFTLEDYEKARDFLQPTIKKRAFHVISENNRVLAAEQALKAGDLKKLGELLNESHESLRIYFEVSCPELDWLTDMARTISGCYGSRMTGAGFGGCTITLLENKAVAEYEKKLAEYEQKFGFKAVIYETVPSKGVHALWSK
jgi:galactokinase